ncbi:glycerol kinase [Pitangus sulphuratus]|nr:glycerol kinase [Pitangus sulphuratus]
MAKSVGKPDMACQKGMVWQFAWQFMQADRCGPMLTRPGLPGGFKSLCWRDNTAGHKTSWSFLECINKNFLTQVIEEKTRGDAILGLVLTNTEELVAYVVLQGSQTCSYHEMGKFEILREARRARSKLTVLDFMRPHIGLFKDLLRRDPWNRALEGKGAQEQ